MDQQNIKYIFRFFLATWDKQNHHKTSFWGIECLHCGSVTRNNINEEYLIHFYAPLLTTSRKTSNIRRAWVGNKIVDYLDVVGTPIVGAAAITSSFSS